MLGGQSVREWNNTPCSEGWSLNGFGGRHAKHCSPFDFIGFLLLELWTMQSTKIHIVVDKKLPNARPAIKCSFILLLSELTIIHSRWAGSCEMPCCWLQHIHGVTTRPFPDQLQYTISCPQDSWHTVTPQASQISSIWLTIIFYSQFQNVLI